MKPNIALYEGRVTGVTLKLHPTQKVEFRIDGHDATLVVPHRFQADPKVGDFAYAICRDAGGGMAVVLGMLLCEPGETIPERVKFDLCKRLRFSTFGERVLRSCIERVEMDYLKAVDRIVIEPVVLVDARTDEDRRRRLDPNPDPDGLPKVHIAIEVASRALVARKVGAIDAQAGKAIGEDPDPKSPFTVVVLSDEGIVEVFHRPEPKN